VAAFAGAAVGATLGVPLAVMTAWRLAEKYQQLYRDQLRRRLALVPRDQQAALLLPLAEEDSGTREIVEPLLRELTATEVAPAAAPEGRGDEPIPGEPAGSASGHAGGE
jgi:hypothetical protein